MKIAVPTEDFAGPDLTPVIDVVFLLLIFFLVATRYDQEERELEVVLPEVTQALRHEDRWMRLRAASVLGLMKAPAAPALPDLQRLKEDPDEFVREVAAESIRRIEADKGAKKD